MSYSMKIADLNFGATMVEFFPLHETYPNQYG